ncbi:hypothetical protein BGZ65_012287 [Modicella reniformis]|uniref:Uncharacterized protein n=1 Tax=Modicella reniformis TaxID=1440133 RepID=A0A9P6LVC2_9FUNG|nr:hypothetical protein BGZ65_012287 [Modicella reniformis]
MVSEHFVFPTVAAVIAGKLQGARQRSESKHRDAQQRHAYEHVQQQQPQERYQTRIEVDPLDSSLSAPLVSPTFDTTGARRSDSGQGKSTKKGAKIYKEVEEEMNQS